MKRRIFVPLALISLLGLLIIQQSCVKEDFDKVPALYKQVSWEKTTTIAELKAIYKDTAGIIDSLANDTFWQTLATNGVTDSSLIIEGVVLSSDSAANFYETVTIMDETGGIDLKINASDLYLTYGLKPGKKVLVKVNGLAIDNYYGVFQMGLAYTDENTIKVTGIDPSEVSNHIQMSGEKVALTPKEVTISTLDTTYVQKLIKIDNVQFRNEKATFSEAGTTTNRTLVDSEGNVIFLRTSGYSKFSQDSLPSKSGSITGVLGIYGPTYQLTIRDLSDINFTNPRFEDNVPTPNTSIAQLKSLCTSNLVQITQDVVIEAVVNANDESGNLYKQLFIEDQSGAIEFKVDVVDLYKTYPVGTKITVNCKDLYVGKYGNVIQLGGIYDNAIGRLSATEFSKNVFIIENDADVIPVETTIGEINNNLIGKVITLSNVQFTASNLGLPFAGSSVTNRNLEDINGNEIIVRTSAYANFASKILPEGSGTITAVLSKYYDDYQLYIRDYDEVQMQQPRFEITHPMANTTIAALKGMCTSSLVQITQDVIVQGAIVANDESGNLYKQLFIVDETAGIEFKVDVTNLYQSYPVGTKIIINCKGMYLGTYGGVVQLGGLYQGAIGRLSSTDFNNKVYIDGTEAVTPVETTISTINDSMIGKLIVLQNVQFIDSDLGKTYSESNATTNRTLEDASGNEIIVRTSNYANFASTSLPNNSGTIVAVLSKYYSDYQLYIRKVDDVVFDQPRLP